MLASVGGALLCGAVIGGAGLFLLGRTEDHMVELTLTTVTAYGSFLLAEQFEFSGVLATIVAGLVIGNFGPLGALSDRGREAVQAFWEYAAFVANSLVFLLIGMRETSQNFAAVWWPAVVAIVFVTVGRAAAVYPVSAIFGRTDLKVSFAHQNALFWGGLRGALALALALGSSGADTRPRTDHHRQFWRGGVLGLCSGPDHHAGSAHDRRNSWTAAPGSAACRDSERRQLS